MIFSFFSQAPFTARKGEVKTDGLKKSDMEMFVLPFKEMSFF